MIRKLLILLSLLGLPSLALAQSLGPQQIINAADSACATQNTCAVFAPGNSASLTFGITGTFSGTLTFQGTIDGTTWVTLQVTNLASGATPVTTATSTGQFALSNTGLVSVRVAGTSWTSGTAVINATRGYSAKGGGAAGGSGGANSLGTYLVQTATNAPTNAQVMASLGTGITINTTTTGAQSIYAGTSCTNQFPRSLNASGAATCGTVTTTDTDTTIAKTGVDINTSNQVTATHLAAALPFAQGGTAATSQAAFSTGKPANPTGTTSATAVMMGLGAAASPCTITPVATGRVHYTINGNYANGTLAAGTFIQLRHGTGTAPANAAAGTGTADGNEIGNSQDVGGDANAFALTWAVSGLTLSTAVWLDLGLRTTAGTATVTNLTCTAVEF